MKEKMKELDNNPLRIEFIETTEERKNFPAITTGRTWQVMYLAYLIWKHDNSRKV